VVVEGYGQVLGVDVRSRVRTFRDGAVLGSKEFLEELLP